MLMYAVILILAALLLYVLELFIPSGGIIGFFATLCLVAGIVCTFWVNTTVGMAVLLIALILMPFGIAYGLKVLPRTPIGRRLTLGESQTAGTTNYDPALADAERKLVGAEGVALSELRPVGTCRIDGKRVECLAETGVIDAGTRVRVSSVNGIEVKVRPV